MTEHSIKNNKFTNLFQPFWPSMLHIMLILMVARSIVISPLVIVRLLGYDNSRLIDPLFYIGVPVIMVILYFGIYRRYSLKVTKSWLFPAMVFAYFNKFGVYAYFIYFTRVSTDIIKNIATIDFISWYFQPMYLVPLALYLTAFFNKKIFMVLTWMTFILFILCQFTFAFDDEIVFVYEFFFDKIS